MKWTITTPPTVTPISYAQMSSHLRLSNDRERDDVLDMINAATAHAEQAMGCSLVNRTLTATFYKDEPIILPRGPLVSITSVTDFVGNTPAYSIEGYGHADLLVMNTATVYPVVVVYIAGFGADATSVPADIRQAIKAHAATLYENRESISDKTLAPVPHSLADFYRLRSRQSGVA